MRFMMLIQDDMSSLQIGVVILCREAGCYGVGERYWTDPVFFFSTARNKISCEPARRAH